MTRFRSSLLSAILALIPLAVGCGPGEGHEYPHVGIMDDVSYSGQRTSSGIMKRPNAHGKGVSLDQFEGSFIWVDYAAPWCSPCAPQSGTIHKLENAFGDEVVFVTVMTSDASGGNSKPTPQTAMGWAKRFGLDPRRVLAADLWTMTIPHHILFSPKGQTLYRTEGQLFEEQIRVMLQQYMSDWKDWDKSGSVADWMR